MGCEFAVNQRLQLVRRKRFKGNFTAIKKDCRRARNPQRMGTLAVEKDTPLDYFAGIVSPELLHIQANPGCMTFEDWTHIKSIVPGFLVFIEHVVHLPKFALQSGSFGGACGSERMRVSGHKWKLTEDYSQLRRAKLAFELFQDRVEQATRRTLEITKLFKRDRRVCTSQHLRGFGSGVRRIRCSGRVCRRRRVCDQSHRRSFGS